MIAGFVWVIKEIRHLIKSYNTGVIIQTDHAAILDIMQQSFITSISFTIRIDIRLIRAFLFHRQIRLVVKHKPNKKHIILDAPSRLANANNSGHASAYSKLDVLFVYYTTLVEIQPDLVSRILENYAADNWWAQV